MPSQPDSECATVPRTQASTRIALSAPALDHRASREGMVENPRMSRAGDCGTSSMPQQDGAANGDCTASAGPATRSNDDGRDAGGGKRRRTYSEPSRSHTDKKNDDRRVTISRSVRMHTAEAAGAPDKMIACDDERRPAAVKNRQESISTQTRRLKRKATRVLGVIFVVFVLLWTPFFVLNLLSAACARCVQSVAPGVWTVAVWLGWMSSFANPIIYTCFSPAFRSTFKHLLTCCCRRRMSAAERNQQQWSTLLKKTSHSL